MKVTRTTYPAQIMNPYVYAVSLTFPLEKPSVKNCQFVYKKYQNKFLWTAVKFTEIIHAIQMTNPFFTHANIFIPLLVTGSQHLRLFTWSSFYHKEKEKKQRERTALRNVMHSTMVFK